MLECNFFVNTGLMKPNPVKGTRWRPTPMPRGGVQGPRGQADKKVAPRDTSTPGDKTLSKDD